MAGVLGAGDVFFDRLDDNGIGTGLLHMGNATQFQITESSTIKERTSRQAATYGQVLDSVAIKGSPKINVTFDELNRPNLALIHLGRDATQNQEAATDATKTFDMTTVETDVWYELGAKLVTISSVKDDAEAAVADYDVNAAGGLIRFGEAAPSTGTVTVTYSAAAAAGYTVTGSVEPTIKGRLLFVGKNLADESKMEVNVLEAVLTPKNGLDYLSSEFASAQYEGTLNTPAGQTSPYTVTVLAAA